MTRIAAHPDHGLVTVLDEYPDSNVAVIRFGSRTTAVDLDRLREPTVRKVTGAYFEVGRQPVPGEYGPRAA